MSNAFRDSLLGAAAYPFAVSAGTPFAIPAPESTQGCSYYDAPQQKPAESFWVRTIHDPISAYTAALTLFTAGLAIVGALQIRGLNRSNELTRKSLDHSHQRAESESRAYVFVRLIEFERKRDGMPGTYSNQSPEHTTGRITYGYQNSGKTPARNVRVAVKAVAVLRGVSIAWEDPGPFRQVGPMGPTDYLSHEVIIPNCGDGKSLESYVTTGNEIHVFGRIAYEDEFSTDRWTTFHAYVGAEAGWDNVLHTAEDGNDYA